MGLIGTYVAIFTAITFVLKDSGPECDNPPQSLPSKLEFLQLVKRGLNSVLLLVPSSYQWESIIGYHRGLENWVYDILSSWHTSMEAFSYVFTVFS